MCQWPVAQHSPVDGVVAGRLADFMVARERTEPLPAVAVGMPVSRTQPPVTVAPLRFHVSTAVRAAMGTALARVSCDIAHCKFRMLVFTGFGSRELRQFCTYAGADCGTMHVADHHTSHYFACGCAIQCRSRQMPLCRRRCSWPFTGCMAGSPSRMRPLPLAGS